MIRQFYVLGSRQLLHYRPTCIVHGLCLYREWLEVSKYSFVKQHHMLKSYDTL